MIHTYSIKRLISGQNVDVRFTGMTLIAVPENNFGKEYRGNTVIVRYGNEVMTIENFGEGEKVLTFRTQRDKLDPNKHFVLCYYEWKPEEKL